MVNKSVIISAVFFLFLMQFVVGAGFDWIEYGNSFELGFQSQFATPYSDFTQPVLNLTYNTNGQQQFTHPTQPLVDDFGDTDTNYIALSSGNYLRVFDNNLNLYTETFVGMNPVGQMGVVEWTGSGSSDIAGFWRENSTQLHFKVFEVNHTTLLINEIFDYNFTHPATNGVSGVRCQGANCYTILYDNNGSGYRWLHFELNSTSQVAYPIYSSYEQAYAPIEPPTYQDYDGDGTTDFLSFSTDNAVVYDANGIVIGNWSSQFGSSYSIRSAKMFDADASPYNKVAIVTNHGLDISQCGSGQFSCVKTWVFNIVDESNVFSSKTLGVSGSGDNAQFQGLAVRDYNGDGYYDLWIIAQAIGTNKQANMRIYKGDGTILYTSDSLPTTYGGTFPSTSMTIARLNGVDSTFETMHYAGGGISIWDTASNSVVYEEPLQVISGQGACVPADLNYDSFLDAVCVDSGSIELLTPNITNYNPTISEVAYSPSTSVAVNQTLTAIITASDVESDTILYAVKCSNSVDWTDESSSNAKNCVYGSVGSYNHSVGVRDSFHENYNIFSQTILVTETGEVCDNDGICEAGQGETFLNCPNDCTTPSNTTTSSVEGSLTLPTQLVDTENINVGLLPEIYYGTLGFMSSVLAPLIVLVFLVLFVMIMLVIGSMIKKIGRRASRGG